MMEQNERMSWLSVVRGFTILLVVMAHIQLLNPSTGECYDICRVLSEPFDSIRMPLFIFSSGGLLYLSRISKGWSISRLYVDKAQRILIPFVFFVTVYYGVKILFASVIKHPIDVSWRSFIESFYLFEGHASGPLWFLATLSVLMLLYPLFCWLLKRKLTAIGFWLFTLLFFFVDLGSLLPDNYFYLLCLNHYLVYFYSGILFFCYRLYKHLDHRWAFFTLLLLYSILNYFEVTLVTSLVGVAMMISAGQLIARCAGWLFCSFRDYIFQIYLMSFFCQGLVELLLWPRSGYDDRLFWLFYCLNIVFGIYLPVLVSKVVERCPLRFIRLCFGLK